MINRAARSVWHDTEHMVRGLVLSSMEAICGCLGAIGRKHHNDTKLDATELAKLRSKLIQSAADADTVRTVVCSRPDSDFREIHTLEY